MRAKATVIAPSVCLVDTTKGGLMQQPIVGYHLDDESHWVAELACGHCQHVRHNPPWVVRHWVVTEMGRAAMLGLLLGCKKCDANAPRDY